MYSQLDDSLSEGIDMSEVLSGERDPSPAHDTHASTAASEETPEKLDRRDSETNSLSSSILGSDIDDDDDDFVNATARSPRQRAPLPPLPDLRFQNSYLSSIAGADTYGKIAFITIRDQVCYAGSLRGTRC